MEGNRRPLTAGRAMLRFVQLSSLGLAYALSSGCGGSAKSPLSNQPSEKAPPTRAADNTFADVEHAAELGSVDSQLALARRLADGVGVSKNPAKACEWFERAAKGGAIEGMIGAARCFSGNWGIPQDSDRATDWWQKAADKGNAEAEYEFGMAHALVGKKGTLIFANGDKAREEADKFVLWETRAADQAYSPAIHALAMTYLLGATAFGKSDPKLVSPDPERAMTLFHRAADAGYWNSQWALAVLYQAGFRGIKPDKALSDKYWGLLANQTSIEAERGIADLYWESDKKSYVPEKNKYHGRGLSYYETNDVAREWWEKAAAQGDAASLEQLGVLYRDGAAGVRDAQKAVGDFRKAADLGRFSAMAKLAYSYVEGFGVVRDYNEAFKWVLAAANENETASWSDVHRVRGFVGKCYENGWGTTKDPVLAYAWYNISASGGYGEAKKDLARIENELSPDQVREAQRLSAQWSPGHEMRPVVRTVTADSASASTGQSGDDGLTRQSVGSGFFISSDGYLLTNHHVVADCKEIRLPSERKTARRVVEDTQNDLAVIKIDATAKHTLTFPSADSIRQGEDVYVFGFPLEGFLPAAGNFTPGMVAALAGPGNNASLIQITAPVQPGNSGGPVMDRTGHVVGVIVGKADALKIAKATGDIPQNVNFSIAPQTIQAFLEGNQIKFAKESELFAFSKSAVQIAELARSATMKVECWR